MADEKHHFYTDEPDYVESLPTVPNETQNNEPIRVIDMGDPDYAVYHPPPPPKTPGFEAVMNMPRMPTLFQFFCTLAKQKNCWLMRLNLGDGPFVPEMLFHEQPIVAVQKFDLLADPRNRSSNESAVEWKPCPGGLHTNFVFEADAPIYEIDFVYNGTFVHTFAVKNPARRVLLDLSSDDCLRWFSGCTISVKGHDSDHPPNLLRALFDKWSTREHDIWPLDFFTPRNDNHQKQYEMCVQHHATQFRHVEGIMCELLHRGDTRCYSCTELLPWFAEMIALRNQDKTQRNNCDEDETDGDVHLPPIQRSFVDHRLYEPHLLRTIAEFVNFRHMYSRFPCKQFYLNKRPSSQSWNWCRICKSEHDEIQKLRPDANKTPA